MKTCLSFLFLLCLSVSIYSQKPEARLVDEIELTACGDMMGRLDLILGEWRKNSSERIAIIYYGQSYRRYPRYDKDHNKIATILDFAHPDDGLNWAKGIPDYISLRNADWKDERSRELAEKIKTNVQLIDGGYKSRLTAQIWFLPTGVDVPKPETHLTRPQIAFGAREPLTVPRYYYCY